MNRTRKRLGLAGIMILGLLAAACARGANAGTGGSGQPTLRVASPSNGAQVPGTFVVKLDANVPLGEPGTGEHHVHLCYDGNSCSGTGYSIVYGNSFTVTGLSPGPHTIEASLRNADHSDAGPTDTITVTVGADGTGSVTPGSTGSAGSTGGGYGY